MCVRVCVCVCVCVCVVCVCACVLLMNFFKVFFTYFKLKSQIHSKNIHWRKKSMTTAPFSPTINNGKYTNRNADYL